MLKRLHRLTGGREWRTSMGDYQSDDDEGTRAVLFWDWMGGYWVAYAVRRDHTETQHYYGVGGHGDAWESAIRQLGEGEGLWA
jgi:hypothetical protein